MSHSLLINDLQPNSSLLGGGTFGCTDTQAHITVVERHPQMMLNSVRLFNPASKLGVDGSSRGRISKASMAEPLKRKNRKRRSIFEPEQKLSWLYMYLKFIYPSMSVLTLLKAIFITIRIEGYCQRPHKLIFAETQRDPLPNSAKTYLTAVSAPDLTHFEDKWSRLQHCYYMFHTSPQKAHRMF